MKRVHIKRAEVTIEADNFEFWVDDDWSEEDIYEQLSDWLIKHGDPEYWEIAYDSEELQKHIDDLKPYIDPNQLELFTGEVS